MRRKGLLLLDAVAARRPSPVKQETTHHAQRTAAACIMCGPHGLGTIA